MVMRIEANLWEFLRGPVLQGEQRSSDRSISSFVRFVRAVTGTGGDVTPDPSLACPVHAFDIQSPEWVEMQHLIRRRRASSAHVRQGVTRWFSCRVAVTQKLTAPESVRAKFMRGSKRGRTGASCERTDCFGP